MYGDGRRSYYFSDRFSNLLKLHKKLDADPKNIDLFSKQITLGFEYTEKRFEKLL